MDGAEGALRPDRVSYETLLAAYGNAGDPRQADALFLRMKQAGFAPRDYAYAARIKAYAKAGDWRRAVGLLRAAETGAAAPGAVGGAGGAGGVGREGREDVCTCEPTVHMYNAALLACDAADQFEVAIALHDRMRAKGGRCTPNATTKRIIRRVCDKAIEQVEDKQRQAAAISAVAAAAGAIAMRSGML